MPTISEHFCDNVDPLKIEKSSHYNDKMKKFNCKACDKSFLHTGDLNRHIINVHEGIKGHKCEICGKTFGQAGHI